MAVVQADVDRTLDPPQRLILVVQEQEPGSEFPAYVFVALAHGGYHGEPLAEPVSPTDRIWRVADAAQDTITAVLWVVWPVCPQHDRGLHLSPREVRTAHVEGAGETGRRVPTWECRAGGHQVAPVGQLGL